MHERMSTAALYKLLVLDPAERIRVPGIHENNTLTTGYTLPNLP